MDTLDTLISIALDLTAALKAQDRYERLLEALGRIIPYDAAALHRFDGDAFVPLADRGLAPAAMDRRYALGDHPRLAILAQSREPVRFAADESLPDSFDGLIIGFGAAARRIHACLGCPCTATVGSWAPSPPMSSTPANSMRWIRNFSGRWAPWPAPRCTWPI